MADDVRTALVSKLPSSPTAPIAIGQTLNDKYRVLDVLGEGAMGTVYSAWHVGLEQRVAVKLLRSEDEEYDAVARQRFQREARAAARIQNQHVCRVLDTGTLADGTPYLVMEHLDGCDLSIELLKHGRLPLSEAVRYVRETCAAVAEAHRVGIVHRDLKPANLFLHVAQGGERSIKILDFGVSKSSANHGQISLTRTAALVGSPIYMSPEQLKSSRDVDGRTDIWALGTILVELLTGRAPFDEETIGQLVTAVLHKDPPPLAELGFAAPAGLDDVIQRALHKDCAQRYQTAEELSAALLPFETLSMAPLPPGDLTGEQLKLSTMRALSPDVSIRSVAPVGADSLAPQSRGHGESAQPSSLPSWRPSWPVLALLAGGALIGVGVFLAGDAEPTRAEGAPAAVMAPPAPALQPSQLSTAPQTVDGAAALNLLPEPIEPAVAPALSEAGRGTTPSVASRPPAERRRGQAAPGAPEEAAREAKIEAHSTREAARSEPSAAGPLPNFGGRR